MSDCCGSNNKHIPKAPDPCVAPASASCCGGGVGNGGPLGWFDEMIPHCLAYAQQAKAEGRPVVGICCEYTPRELIMAAGGVPVCLCGGSAGTIPAAEADLPANLCPLIKSTYGYHKEKSNPFLEMADLIVAETTCDGKKKMYELLADDRPMLVLELPQKQDDPDGFRHWVRELEKLKHELETRFGTTITDERLREAIDCMNEERHLRRALAGLMKSDAPALTGRELLQLKSSISGIPCDFEHYRQAAEYLESRPPRADADKAVRVLLTGVPLPHGAERVLNIIEEHGGLVVCMENCTGVKPILEDVDAEGPSLLEAVARKYFHLPCSVMTHNSRRLNLLETLAKDYRPDCIIDLVWQACLTYDVESVRVKGLAESTLGIPYLRIETDYSPSDSARIAVRVEALFETVRSTQSGCP